ncbi:Glycerate 3-kinase [Saliniradius amylolyticus]|uniref:Glycerate 3-kinase n=1 Tax=Saliniradius amylolyticus TaxID=2183582 RepID=A0A2S2E677_9ALTE|nr:kinase [Saliniradius amylolyticus]AWL13166.1 Glycerate 3-kinase [Saliniradius amylolyticus]
MVDGHLVSLKQQLQQHLGCEAGQLEHNLKWWLPLAERVAGQTGPVTLAIGGAQGSGKSTLAQVLTLILSQYCGLQVATLSLDDLYFPRRHRRWLAEKVHPLLATRGVPGTHDVALGLELIRRFRNGRDLSLPRFDKTRDERWLNREYVQGPAQVLILEGWCLGAQSQAGTELAAPVNELEQHEDADGRWRCYVNQRLTNEYQRLFAQLDELIYLQAPDWQQVCQWRWEQEQRHQNGEMSQPQFQRFMAHYERLTRYMLSNPPSQAREIWELDQNRHIKGSLG